MSQVSTTDRLNPLGWTLRPDAWWIEILPTIRRLQCICNLYNLESFQGKFYEWGGDLISHLFCSPLIDPERHWWPYSPALLILAGPVGFALPAITTVRYYRAFVMHPPSCVVSEGRKTNYCGENAFPLILQNVHRCFFYIGAIFLGFLWYDAIVAFDFGGKCGIGVWLGHHVGGRRFSLALYIRMPRIPAPGGRKARLVFMQQERAIPACDLERDQRAEQSPYVLGLDEPFFSRFDRPLYLFGCGARLYGYSNSLTTSISQTIESAYSENSKAFCRWNDGYKLKGRSSVERNEGTGPKRHSISHQALALLAEAAPRHCRRFRPALDFRISQDRVRRSRSADVRNRRANDYVADTGPPDYVGAHPTGLGCCIEWAISEIERLQPATSGADAFDFCMRGHVHSPFNGLNALAKYLPFKHDN